MASSCRARSTARLLWGVMLLGVPAIRSAAAQQRFDRAQLDSVLNALATHNRVMGSVVIAKGGVPVYSRVLGHRALMQTTPVRPDDATMYRVGSISKMFTAVIIHQLIEKRQLSLDTPVSKFYPSLPNADRLTIRLLLSHTSGLPPYPRNVDYGDPKSPIRRPADRAALLKSLAPDALEFAPGTRRQYSNANYILLGFIAERVTGVSYAELVNERIVKVASLNRTRVGDTVREGNNEARSFDWSDGRWTPHPEEHLSNAAGAGAIVSTGADLARFAFQLFGSERLIGRTTRSVLTSPLVADLPTSTGGVGVGSIALGTLHRTIYQHDGRVDGFSSLLTYVPADSLSISVLLNGVNYPLVRVFRAAIRSYYGLPVAVPSFAAVPLPAAARTRFAGRFFCARSGMTIDIRAGRTRLEVQAKGQEPFEVDATSANSFTHTDSGIILEFSVGSDGTVSGFDLLQRAGTLGCTRTESG